LFRNRNIEPVENQAEQAVLQDVTETILVVDDDDEIRDLTREFLEETGYQVLDAASGEQAPEIFKKQPGEIDLVLMDLNMPGMGGESAQGRCFPYIHQSRSWWPADIQPTVTAVKPWNPEQGTLYQSLTR